MSTIRTQALQCRDAAQALAQLSSAAKQALLEAMAAALEADAETILVANARDLEAARARDVGSAMLDRLALDGKRLAGVAAALREVAALPDPVGQVTRDDVRRIARRHSRDIESILGYSYGENVIHRDDLVVIRDSGRGTRDLV